MKYVQLFLRSELFLLVKCLQERVAVALVFLLAPSVMNLHKTHELDLVLVDGDGFYQRDDHVNELLCYFLVLLQVPNPFQEYLFLGLLLQLHEGVGQRQDSKQAKYQAQVRPIGLRHIVLKDVYEAQPGEGYLAVVGIVVVPLVVRVGREHPEQEDVACKHYHVGKNVNVLVEELN